MVGSSSWQRRVRAPLVRAIVFHWSVKHFIGTLSPFQQGREWLASNFPSLYHPGLSQTLRSREERKWSPTKQALIVKQIHLLSTLGNVSRTVWRICILMHERKGLIKICTNTAKLNIKNRLKYLKTNKAKDNNTGVNGRCTVDKANCDCVSCRIVLDRHVTGKGYQGSISHTQRVKDLYCGIQPYQRIF